MVATWLGAECSGQPCVVAAGCRTTSGMMALAMRATGSFLLGVVIWGRAELILRPLLILFNIIGGSLAWLVRKKSLASSHNVEIIHENMLNS